MLSEDLDRYIHRAGFISCAEVARAANDRFQELGGNGQIIHANTLTSWVFGRGNDRGVPESPRNWAGLVAICYVLNVTESELGGLLSYFTSSEGPLASVEDLWTCARSESFRKRHTKHPDNILAVQRMLHRWPVELPRWSVNPPSSVEVPVIKVRRRDGWLCVFVMAAVAMLLGIELPSNPSYRTECNYLYTEYPPFAVPAWGTSPLYVELSQTGNCDFPVQNVIYSANIPGFVGSCAIGYSDKNAVILIPNRPWRIYLTAVGPSDGTHICETTGALANRPYYMKLTDAYGVVIQEWACEIEPREPRCWPVPDP